MLPFANMHWTNKKDKEEWACLAAQLTHQSVCCSEHHQSLTFVSVQHGQSLSPPPPLSLALCNQPTSLHLPSLTSHTRKCAWLMPVSGASFTIGTLVALSSGEEASVKHTHICCDTHQLPLDGPERVIEGEALVTPVLFWLPVSWRLRPPGTCKHRDFLCMSTCALVHCRVLNSELRRSLVSNHWHNASQSLQWGGILAEYYLVISIALAYHYSDITWALLAKMPESAADFFLKNWINQPNPMLAVNNSWIFCIMH